MSRVSFIIPVYNCKKYVTSCISSIEKMQLQDYEVLLIDDGSTDGSGNLCDAIASNIHSVRCFHQENRGVSAARNLGLEQANGDYVLFLDADDDFEPEALAELLQMVQKNQNIDLVIYGMTFDYYFRGKCYRRDYLYCQNAGMMDRTLWSAAFAHLYEANALSPVWNKVFRRDIILRENLFFKEDMFLYEDLEYSLRYLASCGTIYVSQECAYHYRQSENGGNAGRRLKRVAHIPELVGRIEEAAKCVDQCSAGAEWKRQLDYVLLSLYLVLAREKIGVSDRKEIVQVCDDFIDWFGEREIPLYADCTYANRLLQRQVCRMILNRTYITVRHKIAVSVKSAYAKMRRRDMGIGS